MEEGVATAAEAATAETWVAASVKLAVDAAVELNDAQSTTPPATMTKSASSRRSMATPAAPTSPKVYSHQSSVRVTSQYNGRNYIEGNGGGYSFMASTVAEPSPQERPTEAHEMNSTGGKRLGFSELWGGREIDGPDDHGRGVGGQRRFRQQ